MADTVIVGRVGVRVFPDTRLFDKKLKEELEDVEDRNELRIKVVLDLDGLKKTFQDAQNYADRHPLELDVDLDGKGVATQARKIHDKIEDTLGNVKVGVDLEDDIERLNTKVDDIKIEVDSAELKRANDELSETNRLIQRASERHPELNLEEAFNTDGALKGLQNVEKNLAKISAAEARLKNLDKKLDSAYGISLADALDGLDDATADALRLEKVMEDLAAETRKADENTRKLVADLDKAKMKDDLNRTLRETDALLDEVNREIEELGRQENIDLEIEILGRSKAEREIDKLRQKMESLRASITPEMTEEQKRKVLHEVADLQDKMEDALKTKAEVQPQVGELWYRRAQQRLAWLARTRIVQLVPKVNAAAARAAATTLAALSGARLSGKLLTDLRDLFKNIDKNLPMIGLLGTGLVSLGGVAASSASNLFALSASLAQIATAGLALPGILGGMAIGLVITAVAFSQLKKVIPEVFDEWAKLKDVISDNFWAEAADPIRNLTDVLMPQIVEGMTAASTAVGKFFGAFSNSLADELGGALVPMFADLAESIEIASLGTDSFARSIRILGEQGAGRLPRLAEYFVKINEQFATFLTEAETNGDLERWIEDGIDGIKDLGHVIYEAGRLMGALGRAAKIAGGTSLASLAESMRKMADVAEGPGFQSAMVDTFIASRTAMDLLAKRAGPGLEKMFIALSQTMITVLPLAGEAVGNLLGGIGEALSRPGVQTGLIDFFEGVSKAVENMLPALGPLSDAFGALLSVAGTALKAFSPTLATILTAISDAFVILAPAIGAAVTALGGAFGEVVKALAPVLLEVSSALAPLIVQFGTGLAGALSTAAPLLATLASSIGTLLTEGLKVLLPIVIELAQQYLPVLLGVFDQLVQVFIDMLPVLAPVIAQLGEALLNALMTLVPLLPSLVEGFVGILAAIIPLLPELIPLVEEMVKLAADILPQMIAGLPGVAAQMGALAQSITPLIQAFIELVSWLNADGGIAMAFGNMVDQVSLFISAFSNIISGGFELISGFFALWISVFRGDWEGLFIGLEAIVSGGMDLVVGLFQLFLTPGAMIPGVEEFGSFLEDAGKALIQGLIDGIDFMTPEVETILKALTVAIPGWKGPPSTDATLLTPNGRLIIQGLIAGLTSKVPDVKTMLGNLTTSIKDKFSNASSLLPPSGRSIVTGLVSGMNAVKGTVTSAASSLLSAASSGMSGAGSILYSAGSSIVSGLVSGIRSSFYLVQSTLSSLTSMIPSWKGPPRTDATLLTNAGELIIGSLIDGLESRYSDVKSSLKGLGNEIAKTEFGAPTVVGGAANRLASTVSGSLRPPDPATDAPAAGGAGIRLEITNINPVAEPTSVTTTRVLREAQGFGVI